MKLKQMMKFSSQVALVTLMSTQLLTNVAFAQEETQDPTIGIEGQESVVEEIPAAIEDSSVEESSQETIQTFVGEPIPQELVGKWETTGDLIEIKDQSIYYGLPAEEYKITEYTVEKISDTVNRYTFIWDEEQYRKDYDKQEAEIHPQPFIFEYSTETQELSMGSIADNAITYSKVFEFNEMTEEDAQKYVTDHQLVDVVRKEIDGFSEEIKPVIESLSDQEINDILVKQFTTTPGLGDFGVTEQLITEYMDEKGANSSKALSKKSSILLEESSGLDTSNVESSTDASSVVETSETNSTVAELTTPEPQMGKETTSPEPTKTMRKLFVNKIKDGDKVISGTVEPKSTVLVYIEKAQEKLVVESDANGYWSVQVPANIVLKAGDAINVTVNFPDQTMEGKQVKVLTGLQALLPQTGEQMNKWALIGGALLIVAGAGLFFTNKKKNK